MIEENFIIKSDTINQMDSFTDYNGPYSLEILKVFKKITNSTDLKFEIFKERVPENLKIQAVGYVFTIKASHDYKMYVNLKGEIEALTVLNSADVVDTLKLDEYMLYKAQVFKLNDETLFIKRNYTYSENCPFSYESKIRQIIYMPEHNMTYKTKILQIGTKTLYAIIVTTESFVSFAYVDPVKNIVYASGVATHLNNNVEICRDTNDVVISKDGKKIIYKTADSRLYDFFTYGDSKPLAVKTKFKELQLWYLQDWIKEAQEANDFKSALFFRNTYNLFFWYDSVCDYARLNDLENAICMLKIIEPVWTDWAQIQSDDRLDNLRSDSRFIELLDRHFEF